MCVSKITRLPTDQILYIEGEVNYTWFYLTNGTRLLSARTLKIYEDRFAPQGFIRIHRAYLVNPRYIVHCREGVRLTNGTVIKPSRRRTGQTKRLLLAWRTNQRAMHAGQS